MKLISSLRVVALSLLLAAGILLSSAGATLAGEPLMCHVGDFTWQCTDGSETYMNNPEPPISGHAGNGYFESTFFAGAGKGGNAYVQLNKDIAMRFKTSQQWVSWWDAKGDMYTVKNINGVVSIPTGAVVVGIPGDIKGGFDLPGWVKGQLVSTGEWVLARTSFAKR